MLELLYTSGKALTDSPSFMAFVDSWDALVAFIGSKIYKVYRDGTQIYLGDTFASLIKGNRTQGRFFYFSYESICWFCAAEEITGQIHEDEILNPNWKFPWASAAFLDDLNRLYIREDHPIKVCNLDTGVENAQIDPGFMADNLAYAGPHQLMGINYSSGNLVLLDYFTREVVLRSAVRPCRAAAYDCRHNLIVTVESDKLLRIYLLEPVPAVLSAPALSQAAGRCQGSLVRTRLTGGSGEPCPGYLVRLAIAGSPAKGLLQKETALTDAGGYAEHYYFGPGPGEAIGPETLQASVVI